ncbi:hypothetical protein [Neofamilia massiliensis]|uniref:hypothetical protein n=1 Tax=Neofamilia massiliensis TaxID=1673724 RepID=UPI0006BB921E|nr:hypothetical protein [Neofamilia massiliensis]
MFKKPMDNLEGLSEDEIQEKLDKIREHEFTKKEERELILAALKTFLPAALGVVLIFVLILKLLLLWLS